MRPEPIRNYVITEHAAFELERRGLADEIVRQVLSGPGQQVDVRPGRIVLQSRLTLGRPAKEYLVRVFVDIDRDPAEIVTAYRTSKIAKYWQEES